jgi:hypothetical protein
MLTLKNIPLYDPIFHFSCMSRGSEEVTFLIQVFATKKKKLLHYMRMNIVE